MGTALDMYEGRVCRWMIRYWGCQAVNCFQSECEEVIFSCGLFVYILMRWRGIVSTRQVQQCGWDVIDWVGVRIAFGAFSSLSGTRMLIKIA